MPAVAPLAFQTQPAEKTLCPGTPHRASGQAAPRGAEAITTPSELKHKVADDPLANSMHPYLDGPHP